MLDLSTLPPTCTAGEAVTILATAALSVGVTYPAPDVRTLRLWRTKKLVTLSGRNLTRRNLLEILALLKLRQGGMTLPAASASVKALDEERLLQALSDGAAPPPRTADLDPQITLQLLAAGILSLYARVRKGAIVGHTDMRKTGIDSMPRELREAMARLGRHAFAAGVEDCAASVHRLLDQCRLPLAHWAPPALSAVDAYAGAILIDPVYRVPSEDCEAIAESVAGARLDDLVERQLHEQLRATIAALGPDADRVYTIIREFIGRHPLADQGDFQRLAANPEAPDAAITFVRHLYAPVHASEAKDGYVRRCAHCNGLISRERDACVLAGCVDDHPTRDAEPLPLHAAFLAQPAALKYWADPAREELRLYEALRGVPRLRDRVELYPHSDRCDVGVGEDIGVDVKDYRDPVRLAQRLNRSIGRLDEYPVCVLAIAKRRWSPTYRDQLLERFTQERRRQLQVMSVDQAITWVKNTYGEGRHA